MPKIAERYTTCSRECSSVRREQAKRIHPAEITCERCGATVPRTTYRQRYCSNNCRLAALNDLPRAIKPIEDRTRYITAKGYVRLSLPGGRQIMEHRLVMEQILGRPLLHRERVHHRNENRADNRPENLALCASQTEHLRVWHRR